jgi:hypothetical protein
MAQTSGFFNDNNGDRTYNAADFASYFEELITDGIFYADPANLQVTSTGGMDISAAPGSAWIKGYRYNNGAPLPFTLDIAHGAYPRIDRVVVRLNLSNRQIIAAVLTGAPQGTPTAPELTRNSNIWELGIADITVPAAASAITAANITDTRLDVSLCGEINSKISAVYQ